MSKIILSTGPCKKLLEYDGIASNRLVIREQTGKLMLSCKNVPALSRLRLDYFHVKRLATVFHFKNNNNLYGSGMRTITIFGR